MPTDAQIKQWTLDLLAAGYDAVMGNDTPSDTASAIRLGGMRYDPAGVEKELRRTLGEVPTRLYSFEEAWEELVEKDDRTSPEDYPDMCLITYEELRIYMNADSNGEVA